MLHDLGAPVVEDEQVVVGLEKIDGLAGEGPGDVEPGLRTWTMPLTATLVRRIPSQPTGRCWFRGRGGSVFGVASQACSGVILPGRPWCGRSVL